MSWVTASIISTLAFSGIALFLKKLTQFAFPSEIINVYFWVFTAIIFIIFSLYKKDSFKLDSGSIIWFILLAVAAFVYNYYYVIALKSAPNPGYVRAIQSANIILVTIFSIFLFGSSISIKMVVGIILILGGLSLLAF